MSMKIVIFEKSDSCDWNDHYFPTTGNLKDHSGTYVLAIEAQQRIDKAKEIWNGHSYCGQHGLWRGDVDTVPCPSCELIEAQERERRLVNELEFANKRIKQLQFMVDNGLGENDLIDDVHL